ncbi:hypothetical protein TTHERM_01023100 (macronuclear) [Tetrahymena thermophila SB210]|uniref:Uncharacterized protein n=1 Tax=Tetrahymena thermophila (strain SB210) TaxID=312017 RepID=Q22VC1_TETTS|nr:hypothetical protein TTHERM_01023100 [Tetrahymena thermophila SB210]EAR89244.2 hypothetical protein TTHERM_01023100 [Tetrahymena thermophila SB210]|eukprot:XP_001009489.2 hypothetical protein TTHERM_01023100 [Tetrahymena thermophila SB210]
MEQRAQKLWALHRHRGAIGDYRRKFTSLPDSDILLIATQAELLLQTHMVVQKIRQTISSIFEVEEWNPDKLIQ